VDDAIALLSNTDFSHYRETVPILGGSETINHDQTMLSTVFDPRDQTVYFAIHSHFAGWSDWIRYQYRSDEASIYKAADGRLRNPQIEKFLELKKKVTAMNWKDSSALDGLMLELESSGLDNAWTLDWLWWLCLQKRDYAKAGHYADRLTAKYPDLALGYLRKAHVLKEQNRDEQAIGCLHKALAAPLISEYDKLFVYESLAWRHDKIGNRSEAREYAASALNLIGKYGTPPGMEKRVKELEKLKDLLPSKT
jgi:predicted Zn-dependent protease